MCDCKILLTQAARVARKNPLDEFYEAERPGSAAGRAADRPLQPVVSPQFRMTVIHSLATTVSYRP